MLRLLACLMTCTTLFGLGFAQEVKVRSYPIEFRFNKCTSVKFVAYYPEGYKERVESGKWTPTILLSTWADHGKVDEFQQFFSKEKPAGAIKTIIETAEKHRVPIIAFNTERYGGYAREANDWELDDDKRKAFDERYMAFFTPWRQNLEAFCVEEKIPFKDFFAVGWSSGAQFMQRAIMKDPKPFHAAFMMMPGSCPTPTKDASHIHYLLVSGGKDGGYSKCSRFFERCKDLGFNQMYYLAPSEAGHSNVGARYIKTFEPAFYDYVLKNEIKPKNGRNMVGDYVNNVLLLRKDADWIPEKQRVYFDHWNLAQHWGKLIK